MGEVRLNSLRDFASLMALERMYYVAAERTAAPDQQPHDETTPHNYVAPDGSNVLNVLWKNRERGSVEAVDEAFRASIAAMDGPVLISRLSDYLYQQTDFYDTNYHLLSEPAKRNTAKWMADFVAQLEKEGRREEAQ